MIRMTNISINPGTWKYDDLIAESDGAEIDAIVDSEDSPPQA